LRAGGRATRSHPGGRGVAIPPGRSPGRGNCKKERGPEELIGRRTTPIKRRKHGCQERREKKFHLPPRGTGGVKGKKRGWSPTWQKEMKMAFLYEKGSLRKREEGFRKETSEGFKIKWGCVLRNP